MKLDLESQAKLQMRLLHDAMLGCVGMVILLWAISEIWLWSSGQPDPSIYLPRWLTANPSPEAVIPTKGD